MLLPHARRHLNVSNGRRTVFKVLTVVGWSLAFAVVCPSRPKCPSPTNIRNLLFRCHQSASSPLARCCMSLFTMPPFFVKKAVKQSVACRRIQWRQSQQRVKRKTGRSEIPQQ
jgi:hypothetical protein